MEDRDLLLVTCYNVTTWSRIENRGSRIKDQDRETGLRIFWMRAYNTRALSRKVTSYVFVLASFKNGNSPNCNEFLFCSSEYLTDENGPRQCKLQFMMGGIYWSFCSFPAARILICNKTWQKSALPLREDRTREGLRGGGRRALCVSICLS